MAENLPPIDAPSGNADEVDQPVVSEEAGKVDEEVEEGMLIPKDSAAWITCKLYAAEHELPLAYVIEMCERMSQIRMSDALDSVLVALAERLEIPCDDLKNNAHLRVNPTKVAAGIAQAKIAEKQSTISQLQTVLLAGANPAIEDMISKMRNEINILSLSAHKVNIKVQGDKLDFSGKGSKRGRFIVRLIKTIAQREHIPFEEQWFEIAELAARSVAAGDLSKLKKSFGLSK